jgi:hypothetical protein
MEDGLSELQSRRGSELTSWPSEALMLANEGFGDLLACLGREVDCITDRVSLRLGVYHYQADAASVQNTTS